MAESAFRRAPVGLLLSAVACAVVPSRWGFAGGEGLGNRGSAAGVYAGRCVYAPDAVYRVISSDLEFSTARFCPLQPSYARTLIALIVVRTANFRSRTVRPAMLLALSYSLGVSYSLYPLPPRVSNSHKHCPLSVTKCGRPTEFSLGPVYISGHIRPASGLPAW